MVRAVWILAVAVGLLGCATSASAQCGGGGPRGGGMQSPGMMSLASSVSPQMMYMAAMQQQQYMRAAQMQQQQMQFVAMQQKLLKEQKKQEGRQLAEKRKALRDADRQARAAQPKSENDTRLTALTFSPR